jgi:hypothetical protein
MKVAPNDLFYLLVKLCIFQRPLHIFPDFFPFMCHGKSIKPKIQIYSFPLTGRTRNTDPSAYYPRAHVVPPGSD